MDTRSCHNSVNTDVVALKAASRGAAVPSGSPMNSIISSEPINCTGYGTRAPAFQRADNAPNSAVAHLTGQQFPTESGSGGHCPGLARSADPPALLVSGVPMEHPVVGDCEMS